ncbi:MAG TPA: hypothetical protein VJ983_00660 [candidate division Zixibacteria bacterium]|nr:hypothetical protein [candidate division Zixibacteria bacterium]
MSYLPLIVCLLAPLGVLLYHRMDPESPITPYLTPKFLGKEKHTKNELKQAGTAWMLFSLWVVAVCASVLSVQTDKNPSGIMAIVLLIACIVPVVAFILFIAGMFYLGQGIFSRKDMVSPALQSMFAADAARLDFYVRKLVLYTKINLTAIALAVGLPFIEAALKVEASGAAVLINVVLLITAILSFWRMRDYVVKCRVAMGESKVGTFGTVFGPAFLIWYQAFKIRKQYQDQKESPHTRTDPKVNV